MGIPTLPQHADWQDRARRARDLAAQRAAYSWVHTPGQPPYCKGVPPGEQFSAAKKRSMIWDAAGTIANFAVAAVMRLGRRSDTIRSFDSFYPLRQMPDVATRWTSDREFARQRINGINPTLIRLLEEMPENLPVTDEALRGVLPDGESLAKLLAERRLFIVDYAPLQGLTKVMGRFQEAPIGLFWRDGEGHLMPLALQLGQSPADAPTLFTPKDEHWLWLLARTHFQCADGTYHEVVTHLTRTHLVMETFWVAACRSLPPQHPLHVLLRPHFTGTIEINAEARGTLIAPGGPIDETVAVGAEGALTLVGKAYETWSFERFDPYRDIETRGLLDPAVLPDYYYRDDALRHYEAIRSFVRDLLACYYKSDEDVRQDEELQLWMKELTSADGGRLKGLPLHDGRLETVKDLCQIVGQAIFLCAIEHSAVNNGQYDQFGYIPNSPGALYLPPPTDRSPRSEANLVYALPAAKEVKAQLLMVHVLSGQTMTPLGTYPDEFFVGVPEVRAVLDRFRADLAAIGRDIQKRNTGLTVPYSYLDPPFVARSIAT